MLFLSCPCLFYIYVYIDIYLQTKEKEQSPGCYKGRYLLTTATELSNSWIPLQHESSHIKYLLSDTKEQSPNEKESCAAGGSIHCLSYIFLQVILKTGGFSFMLSKMYTSMGHGYFESSIHNKIVKVYENFKVKP
jgi:hypothetical protein